MAKVVQRAISGKFHERRYAHPRAHFAATMECVCQAIAQGEPDGGCTMDELVRWAHEAARDRGHKLDRSEVNKALVFLHKGGDVSYNGARFRIRVKA